MTSKENLLNFIQAGIDGGEDCVTLVIHNEEMKLPELITIPKENFEYKKNYIDKAYSDNLELKTFNKIKIVDYYYPDILDSRINKEENDE